MRQTGDVERAQLSLDEGPCVSEEVFSHLGVILVHPAQGNLLLEVCNFTDGVQLGDVLIGACLLYTSWNDALIETSRLMA